MSLALLPLLSKRLEELTDSDITNVLAHFKINVPVDHAMRDALFSALKGENIDTVAQLASSPAGIAKVVSFLSGKKEDERPQLCFRCPHCSQFFIKEL